MKLANVLSQLNQVERSKFINCLDKVCAQSVETDKDLKDKLSSIDGQLKSASGSEITQLFEAVSSHYQDYISEQISLAGSQVSLLVNILSRDGNSISRTSWIEALYQRERSRLIELSNDLENEIVRNTEEEFSLGARLNIYKRCFKTAYDNDLRLNREQKISDDERTILNTLAKELGLSSDESFAVENMVVPIPKDGIENSLNRLREVGAIFIDKRKSEVLIADEVVSMFHAIQGKELPDKYTLRILRAFSDGELANILKKHGERSRGVSRNDRIRLIVNSGIYIRRILTNDLFDIKENLSQRKDRLKELIDHLDLKINRLGTTLDERVDILFDALKSSSDAEFNALSASGFNALLESLKNTVPPVLDRLRHEFEIEDNEKLDTERLRSLGISPMDILYVYTNDEVRMIRDDMGLAKRNITARQAILNSFASANDKLVESYEYLACRDIAKLSDAGIEIREAEIGIKFEEITRTLLEQLELNVDEDLRKEISTAKDKADIVVSLGNDDVIVGEAKSHKNGDFAKYSSTSRQVKSYVNRCETNGKRVSQVLIIAPSFSQDFIDSAEMDADINISLLEAKGLKLIVEAFKAKRNPKFTAKLLTKGGLLKAELIAKTI